MGKVPQSRYTISLLHRPSKRKEGLLSTAYACAKLLVIFSRKMSYNTEFIRGNIQKVIHRAIQLASQRQSCRFVVQLFFLLIESVAVAQQTFAKVSVRWAWMGVACPHTLLSAFTPFRRLSFTLLQAVSLLLTQQPKGSYQRIQSDGLETFNRTF